MRCKVAAGKRIYFEGRDRVEGEIIDLPNKEARLNIALGRCTDAEAERTLRVADPRPARNVALQTDLLPDEGDAAKPKGRRYRRTDMRAED